MEMYEFMQLSINHKVPHGEIIMVVHNQPTVASTVLKSDIYVLSRFSLITKYIYKKHEIFCDFGVGREFRGQEGEIF